MQVEMIKIEKLIRYEANPRLHPKDQLEMLAKSIKEYGFLVPVLIKDSVVIAGHGRLEASVLAGLSEVPCIRADHLTENQVKAYRIADNRLTELGGWDEALLASELDGLLSEGMAPELAGYSLEDVEYLTKNWPENPIDPDAEWDGMPEFVDDESQTPIRRLTVSFYTDEAVIDFFEKLDMPIPDKQNALRFPPKPNRDAQTYVQEEKGDE